MEGDVRSDPVYKAWMSLLDKEAAAGHAHLSAAEHAFYCVYYFDLEVYNGGTMQYVGNSGYRYGSDLPDSLRAIGALKTAERVDAFFALAFPDGPSKEYDAWDRVSRILEADSPSELQAAGEELDEWYCLDSEGIFDRLRGYARDHGFLVE